jgi:hypothetical protein
MFSMRDQSEQFLFSPWDDLRPKRKRLLRRSWAGVFREFLQGKLPLKALAEQFSQKLERPGQELSVIVGVLILQQLHDLTDAETIEAVAFPLNWHDALDIRREADAFVCERTLRNYRRRMIAAGLDRQLFGTLTDELIGARPSGLFEDMFVLETEEGRLAYIPRGAVKYIEDSAASRHRTGIPAELIPRS